jgi:hypothetical protein
MDRGFLVAAAVVVLAGLIVLVALPNRARRVEPAPGANGPGETSGRST